MPIFCGSPFVLNECRVLYDPITFSNNQNDIISLFLCACWDSARSFGTANDACRRDCSFTVIFMSPERRGNLSCQEEGGTTQPPQLKTMCSECYTDSVKAPHVIKCCVSNCSRGNIVNGHFRSDGKYAKEMMYAVAKGK